MQKKKGKAENGKGAKRRRRDPSSRLSARSSPAAANDFIARPRQLCENFCAYYKPGKDEELACLAFMIVKGLIRKGMRITLEKRGRSLDQGSSRALSENICPTCPFYEDGCDFAAGKAASQPCGGYILLAQLIGSGAIAVDDLQNMV
jgi:hypothetical protein